MITQKFYEKKIIWSARKRGWAEAGDLLNAFIDSGGIDMIDDADLKNFYRLLVCDDMFLMCLIAKTKECPSELEGNRLNCCNSLHRSILLNQGKGKLLQNVYNVNCWQKPSCVVMENEFITPVLFFYAFPLARVVISASAILLPCLDILHVVSK